MKLKIRLSLIVIAIVVFILVGMSVVQMRMVSEMSIASSKKQMQYLVGSQAEYWKGRFNGYLETMRAVADIMANVAVNHVNEISGKNREGIDTLMREVSKFKVEYGGIGE
jgi:hypothetical protein